MWTGVWIALGVGLSSVVLAILVDDTLWTLAIVGIGWVVGGLIAWGLEGGDDGR